MLDLQDTLLCVDGSKRLVLFGEDFRNEQWHSYLTVSGHMAQNTTGQRAENQKTLVFSQFTMRLVGSCSWSLTGFETAIPIGIFGMRRQIQDDTSTLKLNEIFDSQ